MGDTESFVQSIAPPSACIIVAGMHRSGTSATARLVGMMGAGLPKTMLPPAPDNPTGFWESAPIMERNDALLAEFGTEWHGWTSIDPEHHHDIVQRHAPLLRDSFLQEFAGHALAVLKDPRICRLAPVWASVLTTLNCRALWVLPIRNPLEVARSLEERNHLSRTHALLCWCRHVLEAERASRGRRRSIVLFDELLHQPQRALQSTFKMLKKSGLPARMPSSEEIAAFLTSELRHHASSIEDLARQDDLPHLPGAIYAAMQRLSRRDNDRTAIASLEVSARGFETVSHVATHFAARQAA